MERKRRTAALALLLTAVLLLCMVPALAEGDTEPDGEIQIGRASCRERVSASV